jgi:plasmid stabilization system protein ParE
VAKHPVLKLQITGPARRDIATIAKWSLREFGEAAAMRYRTLIRQALLDIEADPPIHGTFFSTAAVATWSKSPGSSMMPAIWNSTFHQNIGVLTEIKNEDPVVKWTGSSMTTRRASAGGSFRIG